MILLSMMMIDDDDHNITTSPHIYHHVSSSCIIIIILLFLGSIGVAKHLAPFLPGHPVIPCRCSTYWTTFIGYWITHLSIHLFLSILHPSIHLSISPSFHRSIFHIYQLISSYFSLQWWRWQCSDEEHTHRISSSLWLSIHPTDIMDVYQDARWVLHVSHQQS